jgi:hypothetical protein
MRRWLDLAVLGLMLMVLSACSKGIATSQAHAWPEKGESACIHIPTVYTQTGEASWTWLGVTVGQTTRQELLEMLGDPKETNLWFGFLQPRFLQACILGYEINDERVTFWIVNDIVTGIEFSKSSDSSFSSEELPSTVYDARNLYGLPTLVSWTPYGPGYRTVIWTDRGVLIQAVAVSNAWVAQVFYFSPVAESDFNYTPWAQLVLNQQPDLTGDVVYDLRRDPFDWAGLDESNR